MRQKLIKHAIPHTCTVWRRNLLHAIGALFVCTLPLEVGAQAAQGLDLALPESGGWDRLTTTPTPSIALDSPQISAITQPSSSYGQIFFRSWLPLTAAEFTLLGVTAMLPKDWTGWSAHFVRDGINHLERAYTRPPTWDDDWWVHNYVGHPYGGSLYYNTVRSQGASPVQSFVFSAVLSTQWEYFFEAFAERPSIQDLVVTPVAGSILGELTHQLTLHLERNGTTTGEKIIIFVTNPMHVAFSGF